MSTVQQPQSGSKVMIEEVFENVSRTGSTFAAFIPVVSPFPIAAAFMSVAIYLGLLLVLAPTSPYINWARVIAVGSGTLGTLLVWVIVVFFYRGSANVNRANVASFEGLMRRLTQAASWLAALENSPSDSCPVPSGLCEEAKRLKPIVDLSKKEARDTFEAICKELVRPKNVTWSWATGYVNAWKSMHRIDEAFIYLGQRELVIHDALHDEMSLKDAVIDNRDELLKKLRIAVTTLSAEAAVYLNEQAPRQEASSPKTSTAPAAVQNASKAVIVTPRGIPITCAATQKCPNHVPGETQARAAIHEVRFTLHQFRDDRWEKLVRVRNHLMRLTIFTAVSIYAFLEFAIIAGATPETLKAITAFFLIGAIVALFSRLYDQSKSDASLDDFRLAGARVMAAVIFSGLAAVGGVLFQKLVITDTSLGFSLSLPNVLVAAAFGLTPSIFVNAIQKQADQYKSDLKSTEAPSSEKAKIVVTS